MCKNACIELHDEGENASSQCYHHEALTLSLKIMISVKIEKAMLLRVDYGHRR